jgi:AmiR/NasT family two-component response regulator
MKAVHINDVPANAAALEKIARVAGYLKISMGRAACMLIERAPMDMPDVEWLKIEVANRPEGT